jgi:hypothetical protein
MAGNGSYKKLQVCSFKITYQHECVCMCLFMYSVVGKFCAPCKALNDGFVLRLFCKIYRFSNRLPATDVNVLLFFFLYFTFSVLFAFVVKLITFYTAFLSSFYCMTLTNFFSLYSKISIRKSGFLL